MDNKELIIKAMEEAGKPLRPGEIAELAGIDKTAVDKAIKVLKKEGLIVSPKMCYYEPKK